MPVIEMGATLRAIRQRRGLSQGQVGIRSGLTCAYVSRVELGHTNPGLSTLKRWSIAFRLTLPQLLMELENATTGNYSALTASHANQDIGVKLHATQDTRRGLIATESTMEGPRG